MNQADSVTASISVTDFAGNTGTLTGSTKSFTDDNVAPDAITSFAGASGETLIINKRIVTALRLRLASLTILLLVILFQFVLANEIATTIASGEKMVG